MPSTTPTRLRVPNLLLALALLAFLALPAVAAQAADGGVELIRDVEPSSEEWTEKVHGCFILCAPPPTVRGSQPQHLTRVGDLLFFSAFTFEHGRELWVSDGTAAGTRQVVDSCPGPCSGEPVLYGDAGGELVFWAREDPSQVVGRILRSDGSAEGTVPLGGVCEEPCRNDLIIYDDYIPLSLRFDGSLFFLAPNEINDSETVLWRASGGGSPAVRVTLDAAAVGGAGSERLGVSVPHGLRAEVASDGLYLTRSPDLGSDQPPALLRLATATAEPEVVVLGCGRWVNSPNDLRARPGHPGVAFSAGCLDEPGLRVADDASALLYTDGEPGGTRLLHSEAPGPQTRQTIPLGWLGDVLYFAIRGSGEESGELWMVFPSTGTAVELATGLGRVQEGFVQEGRVFFRSALELWAFDPESSTLDRLAEGVSSVTPVAGRVLFSAIDEAGREPWESDGTVAGTRRLADVNPGPGDSSPNRFTALDRVYFSADNGAADQELMAFDETTLNPDRCATDGDTLCIADGRFRVRVRYTNQHDGGTQGDGQAVVGTENAGFFYFFRPSNLELVVKVLDGTGINGHHWVFYGGITDLEYDLEVTDLETGRTQVFHHAPGDLCGGAETTTFPSTAEDRARDAARWAADLAASPRTPAVAPPAAPAIRSEPLSPPPCAGSDTELCLGGGWGFFGVEARYTNQYAGGVEGQATAVRKGADSGYFWFFNERNPELLVKVLDGGDINGHWWVFIGGLTTLETEITVTDSPITAGARSKTYVKPAESTCGIFDDMAFP